MTVSVNNLHISEENILAPDQLSALLAEARVAVGYSIDDLAETTGLVNEEIQRVEDGTDADPQKVRRIAAALKVPVSALKAICNA